MVDDSDSVGDDGMTISISAASASKISLGFGRRSSGCKAPGVALIALTRAKLERDGARRERERDDDDDCGGGGGGGYGFENR